MGVARLPRKSPDHDRLLTAMRLQTELVPPMHSTKSMASEMACIALERYEYLLHRPINLQIVHSWCVTRIRVHYHE